MKYKRTCRAAVWAQMNAPVVLISRTRFHVAKSIWIACSQATTPAKQHKIFIPPNSVAASAVISCTSSASVTLTVLVIILARGKSVINDSIAAPACDRSISKSARPERPCSRRARAFTRARVPAPPVTGRINASLVNSL